MDKWILVVESNCLDPSKEREFNQWYDRIHLPDILAMAGAVRASRYENPNPGEQGGRYIALYELETEDAVGFVQSLAENMGKWIEQERLSPLLQAVSASLYRMITPPVGKE
ncbi:MAG: hypothetical protein IBX68_06420 [Dehalococcoidia bacterium]|nr:hypothetical protein [Dehalococcoidia bacterium]